MTTKVIEIAGTQYLRVPKSFSQMLNIKTGSKLEVALVKGTLRYKKGKDND